MKTLKEGLFWFVMFYVVIVSFLFIRQAFIVHDTMYKPVVLEQNQKYETFITESRTKLANYKSLATTQEDINCLNEVEKAINISYRNQHLGVSTYKELFEYYYGLEENDYNYNYINIINKCGFKDDKSTSKKDATKYALSNVVLIEPILSKMLRLYELNFNFNDLILHNTVVIEVDNMLKNTEQSTRDLIINNEKKYISSILELVGEKYE